MSIDIERARAETPGCAARIHFNNCGAGLMPAPVIDTVKNHLDLEARIGGYEAAAEQHARLEAVYTSVARLIHCSPEEIALMENATRAWDMVFYALKFGPGDRILTSISEYASNYIAFLHMARRRGVRVEAVANDAHGQLCVESLEAMIDGRVKLIAVTHIPTNGGLVNPAAAIGAVATAHGIPFLLDACQSVGQVPIDVDAMSVDMLSATSRKYLRGPRGSGFLYVRKTVMPALEPPFLDLYAASWVGRDRYEMRADARRFESWERSVATQLGLGAAVDYALDWGMEAIHTRVTALADLLRRRLIEHPGIELLDLGTERCGIVSFSTGERDPKRIVAALAAQRINASTSTVYSTRLDMQGRGIEALVRAGIHYYNTEDEVARFMDALTEAL